MCFFGALVKEPFEVPPSFLEHRARNAIIFSFMEP